MARKAMSRWLVATLLVLQFGPLMAQTPPPLGQTFQMAGMTVQVKAAGAPSTSSVDAAINLPFAGAGVRTVVLHLDATRTSVVSAFLPDSFPLDSNGYHFVMSGAVFDPKANVFVGNASVEGPGLSKGVRASGVQINRSGVVEVKEVASAGVAEPDFPISGFMFTPQTLAWSRGQVITTGVLHLPLMMNARVGVAADSRGARIGNTLAPAFSLLEGRMIRVDSIRNDTGPIQISGLVYMEKGKDIPFSNLVLQPGQPFPLQIPPRKKTAFNPFLLLRAGRNPLRHELASVELPHVDAVTSRSRSPVVARAREVAALPGSVLLNVNNTTIQMRVTNEGKTAGGQPSVDGYVELLPNAGRVNVYGAIRTGSTTVDVTQATMKWDRSQYMVPFVNVPITFVNPVTFDTATGKFHSLVQGTISFLNQQFPLFELEADPVEFRMHVDLTKWVPNIGIAGWLFGVQPAGWSSQAAAQNTHQGWPTWLAYPPTVENNLLSQLTSGPQIAVDFIFFNQSAPPLGDLSLIPMPTTLEPHRQVNFFGAPLMGLQIMVRVPDLFMAAPSLTWFQNVIANNYASLALVAFSNGFLHVNFDGTGIEIDFKYFSVLDPKLAYLKDVDPALLSLWVQGTLTVLKIPPVIFHLTGTMFATISGGVSELAEQAQLFIFNVNMATSTWAFVAGPNIALFIFLLTADILPLGEFLSSLLGPLNLQAMIQVDCINDPLGQLGASLDVLGMFTMSITICLSRAGLIYIVLGSTPFTLPPGVTIPTHGSAPGRLKGLLASRNPSLAAASPRAGFSSTAPFEAEGLRYEGARTLGIDFGKTADVHASGSATVNGKNGPDSVSGSLHFEGTYNPLGITTGTLTAAKPLAVKLNPNVNGQIVPLTLSISPAFVRNNAASTWAATGAVPLNITYSDAAGATQTLNQPVAYTVTLAQNMLKVQLDLPANAGGPYTQLFSL